MAGDVVKIRDLIVTTVSALDGWTVSRFAPELFGRDADRTQHHAFAVAMPDTQYVSGRQRPEEGFLARSIVEITWAHRLRGDAQVDDYGEAIDAEWALVKAVRGIATAHVLVDSLSRRAGVEGFVIGTARFHATHRYALS